MSCKPDIITTRIHAVMQNELESNVMYENTYADKHAQKTSRTSLHRHSPVEDDRKWLLAQPYNRLQLTLISSTISFVGRSLFSKLSFVGRSLFSQKELTLEVEHEAASENWKSIYVYCEFHMWKLEMLRMKQNCLSKYVYRNTSKLRDVETQEHRMPFRENTSIQDSP